MKIFHKNGYSYETKAYRNGNNFIFDLKQNKDLPDFTKKNMLYSPSILKEKEMFPLHSAVASNDLFRLKELISSGRDINERSGCGDTPLILAAKKGNLEATKILISAGCDINATDNYKQSALYYAVTKYNVSNPHLKNIDYPDMAALLITNGAVSTPIRVDPNFCAKTVKTLSVKHEALAEKFLKSEFHREMYHTNPEYIYKHITDFLFDKDPQKGLSKALHGLINIDFRYENKLEATTHLAHLNSWTGKVVDYDHQLDAEGWFMHRYPPLKVKNLLIALREINDEKIDTERVFHEPKKSVLNKIAKEIESQLSTYYTQINQNVINVLDTRKMKEIALNEEVKMICNKITTLQKGKEFAIASGFPGHAIYIGFRKSDDGSISRRVYNLGAGINGNHVFTKTGRVYPDVVDGISINKFKNEQSEGGIYIKGVIEAKLGINRNYLTLIYDNARILAGKRLTQGFTCPSQKKQLAGNCVLKNNNSAVLNRLDNDALFRWLKTMEMKEALRISDSYVFREKESEKDILSLQYVVKEYNNTKDINACAINFNLFFKKRLPLSQTNHKNPVDELSDFLKTNKDNPRLKTFLNVDGVKKLVDSIVYQKSYSVL